MKTVHLLLAIIFLVLPVAAKAQNNGAAPIEIHNSPEIQAIVDHAVQAALKEFADKNLHSNDFAVTLIDLKNPQRLEQGEFRGTQKIYPASVIKLFYLVAAHRWLADGKIKDTEEFRRASRDMIVDSYNEATGYIVDLLTDTTSGPELSPADLDNWFQKRNAVNRYYTSLGYTDINANRKPWCEGPYGREMQSIKTHTSAARNWLTTDSTARLLTDVVLHSAVSDKACGQMLELLKRDPFDKSPSANGQAKGFTGMALPPGSKLWSKAGWTSEARHDAAYVELPTGQRFVLVTFTTGHANTHGIIPAIARQVISELR